MNCATCKHWRQREHGEAGHSQRLGQCLAVPMLWDMTEWRDDVDERIFKAEANGITAFAQDGSDYRAYLLTRPEHGCVMYALPPSSQKPDETCRKCNSPMKPGKALEQTFNTSDEGTCSPAGPGKLVDCMKCSACGWSLTSAPSPRSR